tara:strand:+ start:686 stop:907 length:222 start_codon:yes stop_codon:yes gene_type:complete
VKILSCSGFDLAWWQIAIEQSDAIHLDPIFCSPKIDFLGSEIRWGCILCLSGELRVRITAALQHKQFLASGVC